jgi:hypothetical protein
VEGVTIARVEARGLEGFLDTLAAELQGGTYRPLPVRRVTIPSRGVGRESSVGPRCGIGWSRRRRRRCRSRSLRPTSRLLGWRSAGSQRPPGVGGDPGGGQPGSLLGGRCRHRRLLRQPPAGVLGAALAERVSDRRMRGAHQGWLKAGGLAGETLLHPQAGTPRGGVAGPCSPTWCCPALTGRGRPSIGGWGPGVLLRRPRDALSNQTASRGRAGGAHQAPRRPGSHLGGGQDAPGGLRAPGSGLDFLGFHHRRVEGCTRRAGPSAPAGRLRERSGRPSSGSGSGPIAGGCCCRWGTSWETCTGSWWDGAAPSARALDDGLPRPRPVRDRPHGAVHRQAARLPGAELRAPGADRPRLAGPATAGGKRPARQGACRPVKGRG